MNRYFTADRPDALWVTDLTYVPTRSGMAYVLHRRCLQLRVVGWRVAANIKTQIVLDALEMARISRGAHRLISLITHSDAGQFTSARAPSASRRLGPALDRDGG